jgi:hypothetical protein
MSYRVADIIGSYFEPSMQKYNRGLEQEFRSNATFERVSAAIGIRVILNTQTSEASLLYPSLNTLSTVSIGREENPGRSYKLDDSKEIYSAYSAAFAK